MKLKDEDIKEIARLIDEGWSYIKLACKFNMGKTNMNSLVRRYKMHGLEGILHAHSKSFTIEEKIAIINRYYSGESKSFLAIEINGNFSLIHYWIKKYEQMGYNGLIDNRGKQVSRKWEDQRKIKNNLLLQKQWHQ